MIDETHEELMWRDIDGAITQDERKRLRGYLKTHPGAAEYFDSLTEFAGTLEAVSAIDAPPALRQRIHDAIDEWEQTRHREAAAHGTPIIEKIKHALGLPWQPRVVFAGAAGCLFGVVGYYALSVGSGWNPRIDISKIRGTMSFEDRLENYGTIDLNLPGVRGTLKLKQDDGLVVSELDITSDEEIEVRFDHGGESLQFGGLRGPANPHNRVTVDRSRIALVNKGAGKYVFLLNADDAAASPIVVRVLANGTVLYEKSIHAAQVPNI